MMGCWNGDNVAIRLGDVSLGQQLIDLKAALEGGVMTEAEYTKVRAQLMDLTNLCNEDDDTNES
jgi:hypothetical protein